MRLKTSLVEMTVHPPLVSAPSEFRRALWVFLALLVFVLLSGPSDLLSPDWWQGQGVRELVWLAVSGAAGIAFGLLLALDIWNLVARNNPLWRDVLSGAVVVGVFVMLVYLREAEVWRWTFASADAFVMSFLAAMATITLLTERVKKVRVYAFARCFRFVHVGTDA
jgi:hypothetical protein